MTFTERQIRDFWAKIDTRGPDECWRWTGGKTSSGYGAKRLSLNGAHVSLLSHRMAWLIFNSDIPEGLVVCHKCDNRVCCNPAHLFLGTHKDNTQDMMRKGRGNVRMLSPDQEAEARRLRAEGLKVRDIAAELGCSTSPVMRALRTEGLN